MKNLKIAQQLFLLIGMLMAGFSISTYFEIRKSSEAIYDERYDMLRTQVESAISVLDSYHSRQASGELTEADAKKQAFAQLAKLRYEPNGYFFGLDDNVTLLFHPSDSLVGQNKKGLQDKMGTRFFDDIVAKGLAGGGRTEYYWEKPGDKSGEVYPKASYSKAYMPWRVIVGTGVYVDDLRAEVFMTVLKSASAVVVVSLLGLIAAYFVIRGISRPLTAIHGALQDVANEDVSRAIPHTDMRNEVGLMAKATEALQQKVRERHAMMEHQQVQQKQLDGERQRSAELERVEAAQQAHVVETIGTSLELLAKGDLTVRCGDLGQRYASLRANFNEALSHLEAAMAEVNVKGNDIGRSKDEIRRASLELSQRTERQAANLEEASAAIDELAVAVRHTAEGARDAARQVTAANSEASRSDDVVSQAITAMSGIEQSSQQISNIIGVIDEIAFQTNLLALNAGVEAARAGEAGKGFAVVAQEVRELAQRSAAAAKEIKQQIANSSHQVENGVQLVGETGEALKRISSQIHAANEIVTKIAHSAAEQDTTLRAIASTMNQLDSATQQNAAMAEETTASAEILATDTEELIALIRGFKVELQAANRGQVRHAA